MAKHLEKEIKKLKLKLLNLSKVIEQNVKSAILAVSGLNSELAAQTIQKDKEVDQLEVEVEEDCLKILALHQPVAIDLRLVIAILKINNDLERIGDLATNISKSVKNIAKNDAINVPFDFESMSRKTCDMLRKSLDSFITLDIKLAEEVCVDDSEVDTIHRKIYTEIYERAKQNPEQLNSMMYYLTVSKSMERIADYATNIAEDVVYMVDGSIIRHR